MADTKKWEMIAEFRIASDLLASGVLVAKPFFDQLGGDLIGFINGDNTGFTCRVQCKYRDCSRRSEVRIPVEYTENAFLLCLYLVLPDRNGQAFLLPDDIRKRFATGRMHSKDVLRLTLTPATAVALIDDRDLALTPEKVKEIKSLTKSSSALARMFQDSRKVIDSARKAMESRERAEKLQSLLYEARIAEIQRKSAEDHLATMQEYIALLESQITVAEEDAKKNRK